MNTRNVRPANYVEAVEPPRDPRVQKFIDLAFSRKAWVILISTAVANTFVEMSGIQQAVIVEAIITVGGGAALALVIAIEDGLRGYIERSGK